VDGNEGVDVKDEVDGLDKGGWSRGNSEGCSRVTAVETANCVTIGSVLRYGGWRCVERWELHRVSLPWRAPHGTGIVVRIPHVLDKETCGVRIVDVKLNTILLSFYCYYYPLGVLDLIYLWRQRSCLIQALPTTGTCILQVLACVSDILPGPVSVYGPRGYDRP